MGGANEMAQWIGLILSPVFLVGVLLWKLTLDIIDCRSPLRRSRVNGVLVFSGGLLFAVWALRFSVGCYMAGIAETDVHGFHWLEVFGDGFLHALQTFSMDEDYTGYISYGKDMVEALTGSKCWANVYSGYAAVLNAVAPVIGGAFILDILASVFPGMRLWLSFKLVWREKLYFSELTEASLALAKSMWKESHVLCRPVIVFTDAYADDEDERKSERRLEAKMLGAICVKDDLAHVPKNWFGKRSYFLIDENESNNLQTLVDLCDDHKGRYVKRARIFLFLESDGYVQVERQIKAKLWPKLGKAAERAEKRRKARKEYQEALDEEIKKMREDKGKIGDKAESPADEIPEERKRNTRAAHLELVKRILGVSDCQRNDMPVIFPVHSYRNLACNLLVELPLYEPLVKKYAGKADAEKELRVTILGSGSIGTQLLLAVYWFGQMLDCKLHITVVSEESDDAFWSRLNFINPEILKSLQEKHAVLRIRDGEYAEPYASINYVQSDTHSGQFWDENNCQASKSLEADYFIVALGSDTNNLEIAEKLRSEIGCRHVRNDNDAVSVISYVVYDEHLCSALNKTKSYCHVKKGQPDVYMHPFGSLDSLYSAANIFMSQHTVTAQEVDEGYSASQNRNQSTQKNRSAMGKDDRDYKEWANLARAMHIKYKVYSLGWIQTSVFDSALEDKRAHREAVTNACVRYKAAAILSGCKVPDDASGLITEEQKTDVQALRQVEHRLAWLEHRRWNAFTRTRGYRSTRDYTKYFEAVGNSYKHMSLKLHPCLIECDQKGIRSSKVDEKTLAWPTEGLDCLDQLSKELNELIWIDETAKPGKQKKRYNDYDFKEYDYTNGEFTGYLREGKAAETYRISGKLVRFLSMFRGFGKVIKLREKGASKGAVQEYLIPKK